MDIILEEVDKETKIIGLFDGEVKKQESIITETTVAEGKSEIKRLIEAQYKRDLNNFMNDESYFPNYFDSQIAVDSEVLVKIFYFKVDEELKASGSLGKKPLLVFNKIKNDWVESVEDEFDKIYPIVKIIKRGNKVDERVKVGSVYTVPYKTVCGDDWNPAFLGYVQAYATSGQSGKAKVNTPDDMPQRIRSIDKNWERYLYKNPFVLNDETDTVYLIPELYLKTKMR